MCAGLSTGVDLVASGLVAGRERDRVSTPLLFGKQLELLRELVPTLGRVAVLYDLTVPNYLRDQHEAAGRLGLELRFVGTRGAEDLEAAFEAAVRERADGLFVVRGPVLGANQARVAELATRERLPSVWQAFEVLTRGDQQGLGVHFPEPPEPEAAQAVPILGLAEERLDPDLRLRIAFL